MLIAQSCITQLWSCGVVRLCLIRYVYMQYIFTREETRAELFRNGSASLEIMSLVLHVSLN
mgnify:CR=1 FL=1